MAISTASRALNGHPHVDDLTRQRVAEVAERLGYRPSSAARALRGQSTHTVGVALPDVLNHFYASTIAVLQQHLEERGYGVVLGVTGDDAQRERDTIDRFVRASVDGIVLCPTIVRSPPSPTGIPIVEINRRSGRPGVDRVLYDEDRGTAALVGRLLDLGHRRIAFIGGQPAFSTTRARLAAYRDTLAAHGIEPASGLEQCGRYTPAWGKDVVDRLLAQEDPPTALFASSSEIVLGVLLRARALGIRVPDDLSIVAFGDPAWYEALEAPVTCYRQPLENVGLVAVQLLVARITGQGGPHPTQVTVEGHIIDRQSTKAPPARR